MTTFVRFETGRKLTRRERVLSVSIHLVALVALVSGTGWWLRLMGVGWK